MAVCCLLFATRPTDRASYEVVERVNSRRKGKGYDGDDDDDGEDDDVTVPSADNAPARSAAVPTARGLARIIFFSFQSLLPFFLSVPLHTFQLFRRGWGLRCGSPAM